MSVQFLIRKDDPPLYLGRFQITDIIVLILALIPPVPVGLLTPIPMPLAVVMCMGPVFFYVFKFRIGKPPGYFVHWLRYHMRAKYWRYSVSYCDTLLGVRSRWALCGRPLPNDDGQKEIWLGSGFPRYPKKKTSGGENPWMELVEQDLRSLKQLRK
jgi:hypothetical protein